MISIHDTPDGTTCAMKIRSRARKNAIAGELGDARRLSLTVPPAEGCANEACIEFLANLLKVPRSSVTIASGQSARRKAIRVSGVSNAEVQAARELDSDRRIRAPPGRPV